MMVSLEQRRPATFQQDDDGVEDLVVLGEVEEVAPIAERVHPKVLVCVAILDFKKGGGRRNKQTVPKSNGIDSRNASPDSGSKSKTPRNLQHL